MMTFLARMKVKEGKEEDFVRLAKALTEKVRASEPETLAYEFFKLRDEPRAYAVYEQFASEAAEEAHRNTSHFQEIAPDLIDCIDGTYVREFLDPLE
ncbi:MAG: antibiotic biosynthesis monooxygenase [Proteobacteria bacterium]|nr:antibiotic biosynthesis monooxygenase [Pseudomonadota bacterium]MCH8227559.1 antibiotic biosynthesis monooxygenase [Pseudomonadota bacterium]